MFHVLLTKTAKAPLTLTHLIIYSNMAFKPFPSSVASLAKQCHLGEREIQLCLNELAALNLVVEDGGGSFAVEPPKEWVIPRATPGETWAKRLAYWMLFPSTNNCLTLNEAAVWSFVFHRNFKGTLLTPEFIAATVGLDKGDVFAALHTLTTLGLLEATRNGGRLAIYDGRFGQVLNQQELNTAKKRGVVRQAKGNPASPKVKEEDLVPPFDVDDLHEDEVHLIDPVDWELGLLDECE